MVTGYCSLILLENGAGSYGYEGRWQHCHDSFWVFQGEICMKYPKKRSPFRVIIKIRKNDFTIFLPIFSVRVSFLNKMPKILGIILKISGLMEHPYPGTDFNKATVPNDLGIMRLPSVLLLSEQ